MINKPYLEQNNSVLQNNLRVYLTRYWFFVTMFFTRRPLWVYWWLVLPIAVMGICISAYAVPNIPSSADPGRFFENLKTIPEPVIAGPSVSTPPPATILAPPDGSDKALLLRKLVIVGATAYPIDELDELFEDQLQNHSTTLRTLYKSLELIQRKYLHDGYTLARAFLPPQDVTDGVITVQIIEGHVSSVEAQGNYHTGHVAEAIMARVRSMNPFRVSELEHNTLLLGDVTGLAVHSVLKPGDGTDDGVGIIFVFDNKSSTGSLSFDNQGTKYTGPAEYGVTITALNQVIPDQQLTFSGLITSPLNNLKYVAVSEHIALDADGDALTVQANYAHTQPGYRLLAENIEGDSYNYSFSLTRPLIRSRVKNWYVTAELAAKDIVTDALYQRFYGDRIRIASLSSHYDIQDNWYGADIAEIKLSQGLNLPGVTPTGTANLSRRDGHSDFTSITSNLSRLQQITDKLRVYVAGEGQYAWSPLLSSEQFGYGGQQFGRAFDSSELTGDNGIAGVIELRRTITVNVPELNIEAFSFADAGRVWNYQNHKPTCASSAGFGLRYNYGRGLSGALTLVQPLNHTVAAPEYGNGESPRGFFTLNYSF